MREARTTTYLGRYEMVQMARALLALHERLRAAGVVLPLGRYEAFGVTPRRFYASVRDHARAVLLLAHDLMEALASEPAAASADPGLEARARDVAKVLRGRLEDRLGRDALRTLDERARQARPAATEAGAGSEGV